MPLSANEINGKMICLQYKYGNKNNYFSTYEETMEMVKKYPIVYKIIPEQFKDKEMTIAFLRANGEWIREYKKMREKELEIEREDRKNGRVRVFDKGRFTHLTNNAFVDETFDLGKWTKDADVLVTAMEQDCYGEWFTNQVGLFALNEQNYDEKVLAEAIRHFPQTACRLYSYWMEHIEENPTMIESIRVKYELYNEPEAYELALFKCFNIIDDKYPQTTAILIACAYEELESQVNSDHIEIMRKILSGIDEEAQNTLVELNFSFVKYLRKGILRNDIETVIAKSCPIAGDILSNEAVLKYKLEQSETEEERQKKCGYCSKCQLARVRIV